MHYLIMCRSITQAQRASTIIERGGITATVIKAPQHLTKQGCAYAVSIYRRINEALAMLNKAKISYGRVFAEVENDDFREIKQ